MKSIMKVATAAIVLATAAALFGGQVAPANAGNKVPDAKLIDPSAPVKGPANAKAVIVEFSDLQCPYCANMAFLVELLRMQAPDDIKVVWMDRPLTSEAQDGYPFHPYAMIAHEALAEAQAQGKFWEMQQWVFSHNRDIFPEGRPKNEADMEQKIGEVKQKLVKACDELGLDRKKMESALSDNRYREKIEKRLQMAIDLGVDGTPTIYVNGKEIGYDADKVKEAVEKAIGKKID